MCVHTCVCTVCMCVHTCTSEYILEASFLIQWVSPKHFPVLWEMLSILWYTSCPQGPSVQFHEFWGQLVLISWYIQKSKAWQQQNMSHCSKKSSNYVERKGMGRNGQYVSRRKQFNYFEIKIGENQQYDTPGNPLCRNNNCSEWVYEPLVLLCICTFLQKWGIVNIKLCDLLFPLSKRKQWLSCVIRYSF